MLGTYPPNLGEIKVKFAFRSFNQRLKSLAPKFNIAIDFSLSSFFFPLMSVASSLCSAIFKTYFSVKFHLIPLNFL